MSINYLTRYVTDENGCWNYTGTISRKGYGQIRQTTAHKFFYQNLVGPVEAGMQLDHLCMNKRCVNPDHLEVVTGEENVRRHVDRHCIGKCRSCRTPKPGASLTIRERGNPHYVCDECEAQAKKRREDQTPFDILAYFRAVAELHVARKAAS